MDNCILLICSDLENIWCKSFKYVGQSWGRVKAITEKTLDEIELLNISIVFIELTAFEDIELGVRKTAKKFPESEIIVLTPAPIWREARKLIKAGASDYIRQPTSLPEINRMIKNIMK